jgi:hypothetical protein
MNQNIESNSGIVIFVRGSLVDAYFAYGFPMLYDLLQNYEKNEIQIEVVTLLGRVTIGGWAQLLQLSELS